MDQPDLTETSRLQELYAGRVTSRGVGDRAECVAPEAILAVVRREGPEADRLATLDHVMACAACHREYEWLMAVDQAANETESVTGAVIARPWWRRTAPLALAASVLLAVGAVVVQQRYGRSGRLELERGTMSNVVLVAPRANATVGVPLTFAWRPVPGASAYVLEMLSRDGIIAFADTTSDTTVTLTDVGRLLPGTDYRWWVRAMDDVAERATSPFRQLRLPDR
jgi:hypothetical protein